MKKAPAILLATAVLALLAALYSCAALGIGQSGEVLVQRKYVPAGTPVIEIGGGPSIGDDLGMDPGEDYVIAKQDDLPPNAPTVPLSDEANFSPLESPGMGDLLGKMLGPWGALIGYGASLLVGRRPRSHLIAAAKATLRGEPKGAVVSLARATGIAHSSEASKAAAGGASTA